MTQAKHLITVKSHNPKRQQNEHKNIISGSHLPFSLVQNTSTNTNTQMLLMRRKGGDHGANNKSWEMFHELMPYKWETIQIQIQIKIKIQIQM